MIVAAILLSIASLEDPDCGRDRSHSELQPCEVARSEFDVLDGANRPPAGALGADAIRFSTQPSLSGEAAIIEVVRLSDGRGEGAVFVLSGHWRDGYRIESTRRFALSRREYARLAGRIDVELAGYRPRPPFDPDSPREQIVCTDGPGYATERVRDGAIQSLTGSCPLELDGLHANRRIARLFQNLIRRRWGGACEVNLHVGS